MENRQFVLTSEQKEFTLYNYVPPVSVMFSQTRTNASIELKSIKLSCKQFNCAPSTHKERSDSQRKILPKLHRQSSRSTSSKKPMHKIVFAQHRLIKSWLDGHWQHQLCLVPKSTECYRDVNLILCPLTEWQHFSSESKSVHSLLGYWYNVHQPAYQNFRIISYQYSTVFIFIMTVTCLTLGMITLTEYHRTVLK